ncbi:hypothetical protein DPSP01_008681 [Paraphaeosphaeria sporulosa]
MRRDEESDETSDDGSDETSDEEMREDTDEEVEDEEAEAVVVRKKAATKRVSRKQMDEMFTVIVHQNEFMHEMWKQLWATTNGGMHHNVARLPHQQYQQVHPTQVDHHAHPISPAVSASNHDNTADTLVAESTRPSSSKTGNKVIGSEQNPINVKDEDVKDEEEHAVSMHMVAREKRATPDPSRQREQPVPKTSQPHRKQSPVVDVSKNRSRNPKSRKGSADVAIGSKLNKHVPQGYADSFQAHSLENSILLKKPKQLQTP